MKKKWIIILFAITAVFGVIHLVPTKAATKTTSKNYKYYKAIDINKDGIKEFQKRLMKKR